MTRKEAIKTIIESIPKDAAVVSSTGLISRELFAMADSPRNFYMTGSMGLASSIGLGVALNKPRRKVVVIEGDGSLLMNLGALITIGHFRPFNLIHMVLDNEAYDSCSGEQSFSKNLALEEIAQKAGYALAEKITDRTELEKALKKISLEKGLMFFLVKIKTGGERHLPRPMALEKVASRFRIFLYS